jgi:hypothetical protein
MWSVFHAHQAFVLLIGATEAKSKQRLKSIKVELETNDLLLDFPEVVYPIRCLGTSKKQADYQTHRGVPTAMTWVTEKVILPTVSDENGDHFPTSGAIIQVAGITGGEIRGLNHKRQDGVIIRPSLCIADDPQTRDSAKSPTQSETRAQTLAADVAYCAGPGKPISVIVPCTVIYQGDMAERITDRELHPEYQGIRTKMVNEFPENQSLWDKYREIWRDSMINDGDMTPATEFYRENQEDMDLGCEVTWPERFGENELSAVQHAMNLLIRDEAAFWSEMQNEPLENAGAMDIMCDKSDILTKISDYQRFESPPGSTTATAFIDIQSTCLYYVLVAWRPGFSGQVLDYGVWPSQAKRRILGLHSLIRTFDDELPHMQLEGQIYKALKMLTSELCSHAYPVRGEDGSIAEEVRVDTLLIDANYGQQTNTVYQFCRECRFAARVFPSHGRYVGATSQSWSQWKRKRGERVGPHWRCRSSEEWPIKHVIYDTNYWKTFVHSRFKAEIGTDGCLMLYGRGAQGKVLDGRHHIEFADQLCAEIPIRVEAKEKIMFEWKERANHPDNHLFDCMVGACVAASMCGIELAGSKVPVRRPPPKMVNFRDEYMKKLAAAGR